MKKFYSASSNAFYAGEMRADYEKALTWPSDAVEISDEVYAEIQAAITLGHVLTEGDSGQPGIIAQYAYDQLAVSVMEAFRAVREVTLNRLQGIGFAAMIAKDTPTVQSCLAARAALLNATEITAADVASLKSAIQIEYERIISTAPSALHDAFAKLNFN